jgi:hypothetical protein
MEAAMSETTPTTTEATTTENPNSNFFREEEKQYPKMSRLEVTHGALLSIQNLTEALSDLASAVNILTRSTPSREDLGRKIGHSCVAAEASAIRMRAILDAMKNPETLGG